MRKVDFLKTIKWYCLSACFLAVVILPAFSADPYIDDIAAAALAMEQGNYDRAAEEINNALVKRSGDPLANIALGTMFLHTRQLDQAFKQFTKAHELAKDHPLALYGFALYYLASDKKDTARSYFERAGESGAYNTGPAIAYMDALAGNYNLDGSIDPVLAQIAAEGYFKRKDYTRAKEILDALTSEWPGYNEGNGAVMTFNSAKPVELTGRELSKPYKSPTQAEPKLKTVSGTITLKADMTKAQNVAYVLYFVDDVLLGMINHPPFECVWDTKRYANAPHTIRIEGHSSNGILLTENSMRVLVYNADSLSGNGVDNEDAKRAERRLWDCLQLKPSRRLAYYTLAKCLEEQKEPEAALIALEHCVGIDPNFRDAQGLLIRRYAPVGKYREIWKVDTNTKLAALTFDDGPNPGTGRILDVLAEKNVKATFFVVGTMAESNSDMLKRMADEGHELQNHTYSHRNLRYLPDVEIERELIRTANVIRRITGKSSRFFRPPGGHQNGNLAYATGKFGYSAIFWTVNCSKNEGTKPENIINQVSSEIKPGSIVLMHNLEDVTLMALPSVIDSLRAKGYKLVTLSELLSAS
ncbi:MAG TPA: polysaccharide deacetylase family protein [Armatimonadota bacterium]|nr:polysaccharide deacetylase family protein [Armatimonadota bacterium]